MFRMNNHCISFKSHEKAKTHASIAVKDLEGAVLKLKTQIEEAESVKTRLYFSDRNRLHQ